jgi:hypothetical protein
MVINAAGATPKPKANSAFALNTVRINAEPPITVNPSGRRNT